CVSVVTPPPPPPPAGSCNAARAQGLVGRAAGQQLGNEALRLTGARSLRWIAPNSAVTMDYRPDRLNIETNAQNRVRAIGCG
ncbi:MAG TPA: I78 family peptidase inhibitor, partial [Allosphingosinicella sp.]